MSSVTVKNIPTHKIIPPGIFLHTKFSQKHTPGMFLHQAIRNGQNVRYALYYIINTAIKSVK